MDLIYNIYMQHSMIIMPALFGISLLLWISSLVRLKSLNKKYGIFMKALSGKDIEKLLLEYMGTMEKVKEESKETQEKVKEVNNVLKSCIQKYGIVRYTAFDDVGSDLSFAVALLDGKDDGVLLNGVYSRDGSSVFAKPVHGGTTKYSLSEEEKKALENARRRGQTV